MELIAIVQLVSIQIRVVQFEHAGSALGHLQMSNSNGVEHTATTWTIYAHWRILES